jgi:cobalt-zinc-cadmium efflux system membrane fusion protein
MLKVKLFSLVVFVVLATSLIGCGRNAAPPAPATSTAGAISDVEHSHDGWWCDEHGVPEEVCTLCNSKLVADFKAKGDWCQEHDRPESQCFICNPSREAEFSARYEAKYGKKPPKPQ